MKKAIKLLTLAALFTFFAANTYAQRAVKLGHFNSKDLIVKMPDYDKAQNTLKEYMEQLNTELESMVKEYQRLESEYMAKKDQLSDLLKQNKEKELNDAAQRIQAFRSNSQVEMSNKEAELTEEIYNKVKQAAESVAKENKYDYIFESNGILWYAGDSDDVTSLISKKLGLNK
ncbi:MAG: OmpH family outer membrane protein [Bacteroidales bacterium]|nr:OmpH family outer membrane protein [Bacteroidales bacterium]